MFIKTKLAVLILMCITLTGCVSQTVATSENRLLAVTPTLSNPASTPKPLCIDEPDMTPNKVATLELSSLPIELESGTNWISPHIGDGLEFYIRGIYAIDTKIAFIFGGLKVSAGTIRSLLLRTTDGGNHWREVMFPTNHHDITHTVFIEDGEGWAIATWTLEGELGAKLWHTVDYGETWHESENYISGVNSVVGIRIFDDNHIQIKSLFWWANPYADRYMILDSYDGGISWDESFSVPVNGTNLDAVLEAYADTPGGQYGGYYQCSLWEAACIAYGQDGSKWQIQNIYSKKCLNETSSSYFDKLQYAEVRHTWLEHETSFAIPVYFYYEGNEIRVKP